MMAGLLALGGAGCDKDEVPPEILRAREQQQREQQQRQAALSTSRPMPTTRELLSSEKRPLRLGSLPLTIMAPRSWTIGSLGGAGQIITLSGPASSGEITIQLIEQGQLVSNTAIEATFDAAKKDAASKPFPVNKVDLRPLGPGRLLEQRVLSGAFVNGKPPVEVMGDVDTGVKDERGISLTTKGIVNPRMLKWNFTFFLPAGQGKSAVRGLNFMSLRLAEFEQDREFLEQMMGTLQYAE
jgi:hypothetical protein